MKRIFTAARRFDCRRAVARAGYGAGQEVARARHQRRGRFLDHRPARRGEGPEGTSRLQHGGA